MYTIKNKHPLFVLMLLIVLTVVACNFNGGSKKTVKIKNETTSIKIEYKGRIIFTEDGRGIEAISPNGYVKYKNGEERIIVGADEEGNINYKIYNNFGRLNPSDETAKDVIAKNIPIIEEHYYK